MQFTLNANMTAQKSVLGINRNMTDLLKSVEKLSSGKKINQAADDPAGLVISKQLQSQIASLNQEVNNISSNIHRYQTASSSALSLRNQLTELRTMAIGAANTALNSDEAQAAYDNAAQNLVDSYNRSLEFATFNGKQTLDGSEGSVAELKELTGVDLSSAEAAAASIETIDAAASEVDKVVAELGATQRNDLESRKASLEVSLQNLSAAESSISDTNYPQEIANMVNSLIRTQAATAMMSHSLLNSQSVLQLLDYKS